MILVSVGTNEARFDRLVQAVAALEVDEPVIVQHGPSPVAVPFATMVDYLPFETLAGHVADSRVFVTHAGVGSIMVALARGRRPVVIARRSSLGEAVDDHQVGLARRLESAGLVTYVEDPMRELQAAVDHADHALAVEPRSSALARDLGMYLQRVCRPTAAHPR